MLPRAQFSLLHLLLLVGLVAILLAAQRSYSEYRRRQRGWYVPALAFSPDGTKLAAAVVPGHSGDPRAAGRVLVWDEAGGTLTADLREHTQPVTCVAFSPDGNTLMSAAGIGSLPGEIHVWDLPARHVRARLDGHASGINGIAVSPDGKTLASAGGDSAVTVWNLATGRPLHRLGGGLAQATSVAFSPDGRHLASGYTDGTVRLLDTHTGKWRHTFQPGRFVRSVIFSDGGTLAACTDDGTVLWDTESGQKQAAFSRWQLPWLGAMQFSSDAKKLHVSDGYHFLAFDIETGRHDFPHGMRPRPGVATGGAAFGPGGDQIAVGRTNGAIELWTPTSGRQRLLRIGTDPPNWYLLGAALVLWTSAASCVKVRTFSLRAAVVGAAASMPIIAIAVLTQTVAAMRNTSTSGVTLLTAMHASPTMRITLMIGWGTLLLGIPLVTHRLLQPGHRGMFLGEWLWGFAGICVLALSFSYDPTAPQAGPLAVAAWVLPLLLPATALVVPWKAVHWRRHAPWQHWSGLGVCIVYTLSVGLLTTFS